MLENFTVGMQIVPATFAGACFILLFCYFRFTHDSSKSSINYFSNFLLALSFFTLLKPFQLLAGDTLVAKLICNARYIALFSIGGPAFVMALETLDSRISAINRKAIFAVGIVFALIYVPFNTLGGEYKYFSLWTTTLFSILFFIGSGVRRLVIQRSEGTGVGTDRSIYYAIGAIIFGSALAVSSAINVFWPLYFAALPSALCCAYSVFLDLKDQKTKIDKLIPHVRTELLQDINVITDSEYNLGEALNLVGIPITPDTFLTIMPDNIGADIEARLELRESIADVICGTLDFQLGKDRYLFARTGNNSIAVAVSSDELMRHSVEIQDMAENLLLVVEKKLETTVSIGVGDTYVETFNLAQSYDDAVKAQEYATRAGGNMAVFRGDITEQDEIKYPEEARTKLLQLVRKGCKDEAAAVLKPFLVSLETISMCELNEFKMHALEFVTLIRDVSINAGVPSTRPYFIECYQQLQDAVDIAAIVNKVTSIISEMTENIADAPKQRSSELAVKTRQIIEANIVNPPTQTDVAKKLGISASHFRRVFKDDMSCTFNQYVTRLKCDKAKEMLADSKNNVTDIAFDLGFSDSNYFSRVFKKETGISPRDYKNGL